MATDDAAAGDAAPAASALDRLAITAWWTAAARARESRRDDRLFDDPFAAVLVGPRIDEFERAFADHGDTADLHAVTTRCFDDFLLGATATGAIRQVVLLAAGLDVRAFRLPWPEATRLFELDQPHVLAYKDCRMALLPAAPRCDRRTAGADLNEAWTDSLLGLGFDPARPSAWLLEGFLYFLDGAAVRAVLAAIARLAAPGSCLGLDVANAAVLTHPSTRHWGERMAAAGTPWRFTSDDPGALLAQFGWAADVLQAGDDGAQFGRLRAAMPRGGDAPRHFLVTAQRR